MSTRTRSGRIVKPPKWYSDERDESEKFFSFTKILSHSRGETDHDLLLSLLWADGTASETHIDNIGQDQASTEILEDYLSTYSHNYAESERLKKNFSAKQSYDRDQRQLTARNTVIKSTSKGCQCGCDYVNLKNV